MVAFVSRSISRIMMNRWTLPIDRNVSRPDVSRTPAATDVGPAATQQAADTVGAATDRFNVVVERLTAVLERIANKLDPPPPDVVGTEYVAERRGCTATWVAEQARDGRMPSHCIVPGTGHGKPWRFYRSEIDSWLLTGR